MAAAELELRVTALEAEVARVKEQLGKSALEVEVARLKERLEESAEPKPHWVDKVYGAFANDPDFLEAMRLGRQYRESLRPKPIKRPAKRPAKPGKR